MYRKNALVEAPVLRRDGPYVIYNKEGDFFRADQVRRVRYNNDDTPEYNFCAVYLGHTEVWVHNVTPQEIMSVLLEKGVYGCPPKGL